MEQQKKVEGWLVKRVREFERRCLVRVLRRTGGNVRQAGKLLDTRRSKIYRLMRRYGLEIETFRPPHADPR